MTSHSKGGREGAEMNWEAIKGYLSSVGDKSADFTSSILRKYGYECDPHGFNRMVVSGIIRKVSKDPGIGGEPKNVYRISEKLMGMDLGYITGLSYRDAGRRHSK